MSEPVTRPTTSGAPRPGLARRLVGSVSRRRRHRLAPVVLLLAALASTGGAYAALVPSTSAQAASGSSSDIQAGRDLFLKNCASCHGLNAEGSSDGPSLVGVGAAAVDFQVGTGRMPARELGAQIQAKRPQFDQKATSQLAAYVASLGAGPEIPSKTDLSLGSADAARGGEIYRTNCAMCHNYAGSGGALTRGKYAPSLKHTTPAHMWEAMLTGPQSMPVFGNGTITASDKRDIIKFITTTRSEPSPGGARLGKIGPVSEGAVGWLVGLGALIACAVWLGAKAR